MKQLGLIVSTIAIISVSAVLSAQESTTSDPEYDEQIRICVEGETATKFDFTDDDRLQACTIWSEYESEFSRAIYFRALLHKGMGRWQDAIADYSSVIDADDTSARAYYSRSRLVLQYREDYESALSDLSQAIVLSQEDPKQDYFLDRAFVLLRLATISDSEAQYDMALLQSANSDLDMFMQLTERSKDAAVLRERDVVTEVYVWLEEFLVEKE